jgi:nucleoid DNA-binding protein
MTTLPDSISKRTLWRYVNQKIKRSIHHYHVFSVITILFEEMLEDLKNGKKIKIFHFGKLSLKNTQPRHYFDFRFQKVVKSERGYRIMRFILSKEIRKRLRFLIDMQKTFGIAIEKKNPTLDDPSEDA